MTSHNMIVTQPMVISNKYDSHTDTPTHTYETRTCATNLCGAEGSDREKHCQTIKLTLLSMVSGVILVFVSAISLADQVKEIEANTILGQNVQFSIEIGEVIHYIQIERGTTALFISAGGDSYLRPRLQSQYDKTDIAISKLSKWIPISTPSYFRSRDAFHETIREYRKTLDPMNTTLREVIRFYTDHNSVFIDMVAKSFNVATQLTFWTDQVAYQMCIVSKEQAGIERAIGSTYFARGIFPVEDLLWYVEKQTLGANFLTQCTKYSKFVEAMLKSMYANSTLESNLQLMRLKIRENDMSSVTIVEGEIWFDNMTAYINILKAVLDDLALRIVEETNDQSTDIRKDLFISALELVVAIILAPVVGFMVKKITDKIQAFTVQLRGKTRELEEERKRTERLLHELLPRTVARTLLTEGHVPPEQFNSATIMFTDVVSFTSISSRSTPMQVVNMLNKLYITIDSQIENFDVYKIETIGDAYMVASGLPRRNGERHVSEIAKLALQLVEYVSNLSIDHLEDEKMMLRLGFNTALWPMPLFNLSINKLMDESPSYSAVSNLSVDHLKDEKMMLRLGFNTGPCVTGIVGLKMPRYCVYGDTVNIASRMESTGLPLKIQLTEHSACVLQRQKQQYTVKERGFLEIKGKGMMRTYWLEGYTENDCDVRSVGYTDL